MSDHSNHTPRSHRRNTHIKQKTNSLTSFEGGTCSWLQFRDTFGALIVNRTTVSNVQKFNYIIVSLTKVAKDLINNLQITNQNFFAWQLVTQRYNNKRLIAMMHAKHLCQMPQIRKGDALSLRHLINHVPSLMNSLQTLSLNVPVQT